MKILVTGATGFVGYHVVQELLAQDWGQVCCLYRNAAATRYLKEFPVELVQGDLRDKTSLDAALRQVDILFHVAADYRLWAKNPQELIQSNVEGSRNILQAAKQAGVKKVVYTSSVSAIGRPEIDHHGLNLNDSLRERLSGDETLDPPLAQQIGIYKQSKFQGELVAREFAADGFDVVIVNPSTPIGSYDVKPTPTGKVILDFLNRKMPAYLDTGLNFVDVQDVARGHLLAAQKGRRGQRYILGNRNLMLKEMLDMLAQVSGMSAPKIKIPYGLAYGVGALCTAWANVTGKEPAVALDAVKMAKELMFYKCDKAQKDLGFTTQSLEQALESSVRFFKDSGRVK